MKRVFLELGGKSATIVLEDADFGTAALMGIGVCFHAGQGCAIQTRMLVAALALRRGRRDAQGPCSRPCPTAIRSGPT